MPETPSAGLLASHGVTVTCDGDSRSLDYCRWALGELGIAVRRDSAGHSDGQMETTSGARDVGTVSVGDAGEENGATPVVRLWDFQVGQRGPGLLASAASGTSWVIGVPGRPPVALPLHIPEKWTGVLGATLVLTILIARARGGRGGLYTSGDSFDISAADTLNSFARQNFGNHAEHPEGWRRNGRYSPQHGGIYPQGFFECRDGYVAVVARSARDWRAILKVIGSPEWSHRADLRDPVRLAQDSTEIDSLFPRELKALRRGDILDLAAQHGAAMAPVYAPEELRGLGILRPDFGNLAPKLPYKFSGIVD